MAITKYGRRIFTEINRPDRELVEKFRGIPSSNINDMMNRMFNMYGDLRCYLKNCSMVGTAFTIHAPEGDNLLLQYAMDLAQPGDVIVLDGGGSMSRALCGEIMFNYCKSKGIAGFVLDGCIRDADAIDSIGFPVYAKGVTPQGPWKFGPGEINVPIACCGQVVFPGDIIVGDPDGVVVIRPEMAEEVLEAVADKFAAETRTLNNYAKGIYPDRAKHEAAWRQNAINATGLIYEEAWK
ncbi:MAG: RraA family protein [Lachnospiraceae bacterium]|nr:RraA family protein [Lachnospiraceae bacterium]